MASFLFCFPLPSLSSVRFSFFCTSPSLRAFTFWVSFLAFGLLDLYAFNWALSIHFFFTGTLVFAFCEGHFWPFISLFVRSFYFPFHVQVILRLSPPPLFSSPHGPCAPSAGSFYLAFLAPWLHAHANASRLGSVLGPLVCLSSGPFWAFGVCSHWSRHHNPSSVAFVPFGLLPMVFRAYVI